MLKNFAKTNYRIVITTIIFIALWSLGAYYYNNAMILPSPWAVCTTWFSWLNKSFFYINVLATLGKIVFCFILAMILGALCGIWSNFSPWAKAFFAPIVALTKAIPTLAIIVLVLIWFNQEITPIIVAFIVVWPICYDAAYNGIANARQDLVEMAALFKVSKNKIIRHIYIPSISYSLLGIASSAFGLTAKVVVAGEVLGQPNFGIGAEMQLAKMQFNTADVFAWVLTLALFLFIMQFLIKKFAIYFLPWQQEAK